MPTTFKIPRQSDREIIKSIRKLAQQADIPDPKLYIIPFEGAGDAWIPFADVESNDVLKEVCL